jgi:hypothetical protein
MKVIDLKKGRRIPKKAKKTLLSETKSVVKALIITLSIMITVLASLFLFFTNESAQKGYSLAQEKLRNEELKTTNANLKTKITDAAAFSKIENLEELNQMANSAPPTYVTKEDNAVK